MQSELRQNVSTALASLDPVARAVLGALFEVGSRSREVYAAAELADDLELTAAYERGLRRLREAPHQPAAAELGLEIPAGFQRLYG